MTTPGTTTAVPARAGVLGAFALAAEVVDDLVVGTARDVHCAVAGRAYAATNLATGRSARVPKLVHDRLSRTVYGGLGLGLRAASSALRTADRHGLGARLEASSRGRFTVAAVNGLMGDRLAEQHPGLAITMAVRLAGADVPPHRADLAAAFPDATGDLVVFVHGLGETESYWDRARERTGGSYGERLAAVGWSPVFLRANTGLRVAENGIALAALLDDLVAGWPTEVRRIALVGHSMGGMIIRSACAVVSDAPTRWNTLVSDVVTLGTPHLGAPVERGLTVAARALGLLPEAAPFGRVLEYRSVGILDLRAGLAPDVQNLPNARYHLVAATLADSPRHPVSELLGDLLVRYPSATGRPRRGRDMFPGADVLHVRGGHFDLLNHPHVHDALQTWLASSAVREQGGIARGSGVGSG
jgi:pimeloyl-ACP methyl ester carboxylesterase